MNRLFERDRDASRRVTLEEWRRRGLNDRAMETLSRLMERML
jgi:cardiolipin synthase